MLNWLYSWFATTPIQTSNTLPPARCLPAHSVKDFVDNKPQDVKTISAEEITRALHNLHKTQPAMKPAFYSSPLQQELHHVFKTDYKSFLEHRRSQLNKQHTIVV